MWSLDHFKALGYIHYHIKRDLYGKGGIFLNGLRGNNALCSKIFTSLSFFLDIPGEELGEVWDELAPSSNGVSSVCVCVCVCVCVSEREREREELIGTEYLNVIVIVFQLLQLLLS